MWKWITGAGISTSFFKFHIINSECHIKYLKFNLIKHSFLLRYNLIKTMLGIKDYFLYFHKKGIALGIKLGVKVIRTKEFVHDLYCTPAFAHRASAKKKV